MNEFEKHLRRGTGSHRSFLLPTEVKKGFYGRRNNMTSEGQAEIIGRRLAREKTERCKRWRSDIERETRLYNSSMKSFFSEAGRAAGDLSRLASVTKDIFNAVTIFGFWNSPYGRVIKKGATLISIFSIAYKTKNLPSMLKVAKDLVDMKDAIDDINNIDDLSGKFKTHANNSIVHINKAVNHLKEGNKHLGIIVRLKRDFSREGCGGLNL